MPDTEAMAEPLAGITDAIQAAYEFLNVARKHRDWPNDGQCRAWTLADRDDLIGKLQSLGDQKGVG